MRRTGLLLMALTFGLAALALWGAKGDAGQLKNSRREPANNGWVQVKLAGTPMEIGYQHGYLLAKEIIDNRAAIRLELTHESRDWKFYRTTAETILWPRVDAEYQEEMRGIVAGVKARGESIDLWDVVVMNAFLELPYYVNLLKKQAGEPPKPVAERCSAFVATGSYTKDGGVVLGHNNWTSYLTATRWNIVFDITPAKGSRMLMDGMPGLIHSGDDFGVTSAGLLITETTISGFQGFDVTGVPEFARARKAMQYAASIDDFARLMQEGNNGGYANNWLVADRKTGEIASLELGLKNVKLQRTKDGFFVGANFPVDPVLAKEETTFDLADSGLSPNARRARWGQLMSHYKGQITLGMGQRFLGDHLDSVTGKEDANERTLCGHNDLSPRGLKGWVPAYSPAGTAQAKVSDGKMAERMMFSASLGHSCGIGFRAKEHLKAHPEFGYQRDLLRDMPSQPWTEFEVLQ